MIEALQNKKILLSVIAILIIIVAGFSFSLISPKKESSLLQTKGIFSPSITSLSSYLPTLPTLDMIFSDDHSWVATLSAKHTRTMIATGDIIPARSVNFKTVTYQNFLWPYEKTANQVKNADITFANLETPIFAGCPVTQQGMVFCGDGKHIEGLTYAGIDIVNLANNHAGNHRLEGIEKTLTLLQGARIDATGTSSAFFKDIRGVKFAFLAFNDIGAKEAGINWAEEEKIRNDIMDAKKNSDIVIVTYHWGVEYRAQPDNRQIYLGHYTIDSGADLVIGNHPHWIQPIEIYKGKLITYAHGNYIFDQMWSQKTREGVIGKYTFYDNELIDVQYFPLQIEDYGQPYFLTEEKKRKILEEMKKESLILAENKSVSP